MEKVIFPYLASLLRALIGSCLSFFHTSEFILPYSHGNGLYTQARAKSSILWYNSIILQTEQKIMTESFGG